MKRRGAVDKPAGQLAWFMGGLALICVVGLTIYYLLSDRKPDLEFEFAKAALNIGVISLAGTLIDLFISGYERRLARRRYREDLLKNTLARITTSYNRSKAARRKMRARGLLGEPPDCLVRLAGYDEIMDDVIDAQLELEAIVSEVETNCSDYPSAQRILPRLILMEDYLGQIIKEYERERPKVQAADRELGLRELKELTDFVARAKTKPRFSRRLVRAHSQVRKAIRKDLRELGGVRAIGD